MSSLGAALVLAALTSTAGASRPGVVDSSSAAQVAPSAAESAREADMFGSPDDGEREAEMFGTPSDGAGVVETEISDREAEMFGTATSSKSGANSGAKSGANSGAKSGANAGAKSGANSGANSGTKSGANSGTKSGANSAANSGADSGAKSAANSPSNSAAKSPSKSEPSTNFDNFPWTTSNTAGLLSDKLAEVQDYLQIGGRLWLRLQYDALSEGEPEDFSLSSSNLLDVYLDARPNDRIRAFSQARLTFDPTVNTNDTDFLGQPRQQASVALDQLWLRFDIARRVFLALGKQRIRWGAGRFWNPTDFLNQQALNPLAFFDQRLGVTLLKLHVPIESLGWNLYAVANLEGAGSPSDLGVALRAETVFGPAEFATTFAGRKGQPYRFGADISAGVWEFDVRAEAALLYNDRRQYFEGTLDLEPLRSIDVIDDLDDIQTISEVIDSLPEQIDRSKDLIVQLVLGADWVLTYGDDERIIFGVEYLFNDAGTTEESLYPALLATGRFTPLYLGRHYLAATIVVAAPGDWDDTNFILSSINNLSDKSGVVRFDGSVRVLTYLSVRGFIQTYWGQGELRLGLDIPPIPDFDPDFRMALEDAGVMIPDIPPEVAALTGGIRRAAPSVSLGAALTLDF